MIVIVIPRSANWIIVMLIEWIIDWLVKEISGGKCGFNSKNEHYDGVQSWLHYHVSSYIRNSSVQLARKNGKIQLQTWQRK